MIGSLPTGGSPVLSACCGIEIPRPETWNFGDKLVDRARLAIAWNCGECLASYGPDGRVLVRLEGDPLIHARVAAIGSIAEAMRAIVHRDDEARWAVAQQMVEAGVSWPGPGRRDPPQPLAELLAHTLAMPDGQVSAVEWRLRLVDAGLPPELVHLCGLLLGIELAPPSPWNARFFVIERQHGYEPWPAWFHATFVPRSDRGPGAVVPHPVRMLAVSIDASFGGAVGRARARAVAEGLLDPSLDVVWWVRVARRRRVPSLTGPSVGLAAGVVMAAGSTRQGPPPPGHWVFAGSVGAFDGEETADPDLLDLLYDDTQHPSPDELLVVPAGDLPEFRVRVGDPQGVLAVSSLHHALQLASSPIARSSLLLPFSGPDPRLVPRSFLGQLEEVTRHAADAGAMVLVLGESGTGRGALIERLERMLAADGWMIGRHRCDSYRRGGRAFAPFRELLRQLEEGLRREGEPAKAEELATVRGVLEAPIDEVSPSPRFRMRRGGTGRWFLERTAETFAALASSRRVAILLDDLQWADETSVALFFHLALKVCAGGPKILLVGSVVPRDLEGRLGREELPKVVEELSAAACPGRFRVADFMALSAEDTEELVRQTLAIRGCMDPDPALIALLQEHAGMNDFNLRLIVNWLHGTGKLEVHRGRWRLRGAGAADVPDVDTIIDWFAASLGPDREDALRRAAIIGREFRLDLLHQIIDKRLGEDRLATWLDESELVKVVPTGDTRRRVYEFVHTRVVTRLRDSLRPDLERAVHREAATAYATLAQDEKGRSQGRSQGRSHQDVCHLLAIHWEHAGHLDRAAEHWEHLATTHCQLGAYDTALWDLGHELACREAHIPDDEGERYRWGLSTARAHVDRASVYRLRGRDGDLNRAATAVGDAWETLHDLHGAEPLVTHGLVRDELCGNLAWWLLYAACAHVEAGEIARLNAGVDQAQGHLEAAIDWAERLRAQRGTENAELRREAGRVLARAGCTLMSLYMSRALRYLKYEPYAEDARRAQQARVMHLGTRLLTLLEDLEPEEVIEVKVRVLRTQGNVFFWLEQQATLARQHYQEAVALVRAREPSGSHLRAPGEVDQGVGDCLASLRLAHKDLAGARHQLDHYRSWAENVSARDHLATAACKAALIEVVGASAAGHRLMHGSLDEAARLLDAAISAPWASFPELRLRALLLRRWVACRRTGDDPTRFDDELRREQQTVWGGVPDELAGDPEALLLCDVMMDAPWWVAEQCQRRQPGQLPLALTVALTRHQEFVHDDGRQLDLAHELHARARARLSHKRFRERLQPVERQVERLSAIHFPRDATTTRILRCAVWVHESLRDLPDVELERLVEDWTVEAEPLEHANPWWLHGRLGYLLVEREMAGRFARESDTFKEELRRIVEYHSWPGPGMSPASKVFYVALQLVTLDLTICGLHAEARVLEGQPVWSEADRIWGAMQLRATQQTRDEVLRLADNPATLEQALLVALEWELERRRACGYAIHPRSITLLNAR